MTQSEGAPPPRTGKVIHPRVPEDILDRVRQFAARDRRNQQSAVVHLLERGLDAVEGAQAPTSSAPLHLR